MGSNDRLNPESLTIVKSLHTIDMDKDALNFQSETSSVGSDESLEQISGPDFAEFARQLTYDKTNGLRSNDYFFPYDTLESTNKEEDTYVFPSSIVRLNTPPKTNDVTTLFLVDSVNRDTTAFPQPTNFRLKLPRVYKDVKLVQITQLKLLCSFYYFSVSKANIYLPVIENSRLTTVDNNGSIKNIDTINGIPITKLIKIREGTYSISELLTEIQTQMNYTPLFYDFPGGFTQFITIFTVNGDYSVNFNQPGDTFYDSLNNKIITNPTMNTIVSYYWGSRYAGLTDYTIDQLKVAYYYPVFYEVFLDDDDKTARPFLDISLPSDLLPSGETLYTHMIFNMSGIDDKIALYLINQNITLLDTYRLNHTFRYSLINRYELTYDPQSLQISFTARTLNTSLVNLINNTNASVLTSILNSLGYTSATYLNLQTILSKTRVVYTDMFQFLQKQLVSLLGISYATYGQQFFNNLNNELYFQDGTSASGVRTGYTMEYLKSGASLIVSSLTSYSNSPAYWPNITRKNGYPVLNLNTINTRNSLIPYNISGKNFLFGNTLIDSSNYHININKSSRSADVVVNILPATYTVFKFRSPVRQNLQVETLPLPYYYRYSDYNKLGLYKGVLDLNKNNVPQQYFDISYSYVYNSVNKDMDNSNYSTNIITPRIGQDIETYLLSTNTLRINSQNNNIHFEFVSPYPQGQTGLTINNTTLSIVPILNNTISTIFNDSFTAFIYHDRAAFMADLLYPRQEKPLHYIKTASISSTSSSLNINFSTFSGHTYYTIFRSNNVTCSNTLFKPIIYSDSNYTSIPTDYVNFDPTTNNPTDIENYPFVTNYNTDFIKLPVTSTLMGINPENSIFNTSLNILNYPIGYDISGVSNDLTDYVGFIGGTPGVIPNSPLRIDPLSRFAFNSFSPFDTVKKSYLGSNSSNAILTPIVNNVYDFKGISTSQLKIVHWYDNYSISRQLDDQFTTFSTIGIAETSAIADYVSSYPLNTDNDIQFGRGINAIGFLPDDGSYSISSFTFKSSIYPLSSISTTAEDPNLNIKYIGVFSGLSLVNTDYSLSSALTVLQFNRSIPYGPTTLSNTPGFGIQLGTWYEYTIDSNFPSSNISGYTQGSNDLLSYNSMYYMVPFNSSYSSITYSRLTGSLVPYPRAQDIRVASTFYGQTAQNVPGATSQGEYITPEVNILANSNYGPQGIYSQNQSQYEQSMPITTTSIGYKEYPYLVNSSSKLFRFDSIFSNSTSPIILNGTTSFFSEFSDNLFLVNSISSDYSNSNISYPSLFYATSISTLITSGSTNSIHYLVNPAPHQQNYDITGKISNYSTFTFSEMAGVDSNITTRSIELNTNMSNLTLWMWGGGGGTSINNSDVYGGAGAYVKVTIDTNQLLNTRTSDSPLGISTIYLVIGKGGNRDNFSIKESIGSLQLYEQPRYGGGGTSILGDFVNQDTISLQGGGFSGIFSGSNLQTATPLLIVGGGGAAGTIDYGGPGGFGVISDNLSVTSYTFSSAELTSIYYNNIPIISIRDTYNNPVLNDSTVQNLFDNSLTTYWEPIIPAKLNPSNYNSTPNTYSISLEVSGNLLSLSKLRYCGPQQYNVVNIPTGILVYDSINKSQLLYSNTSIKPSDFQVIDNGTFLQQIFDIIPTTPLNRSTINTTTWLISGEASTPQMSIQYSLDNETWIPTNNSILSSVTAITYSEQFNKWYATGSTIIYSSDGINWSPSIVNNSTGNFTCLVSATTNTQVIILAGANDGSIFQSTNGITWNSVGFVFSNPVKRIRFLNGIFWAFSSLGNLKNSYDGLVWSNVIGLTMNGMRDITYGVGRYVICQVNNSPPYNSAMIFSDDSITWFPCANLGLDTFLPFSIAFLNTTFVVVGKTTNGSSFIKYSLDGINWKDSNYKNAGDSQRQDIQVGNGFISSGISLAGNASNQVSVVYSLDGINWRYSLFGAFNTTSSSSAYGPITVLPDMSRLYIEIQKESYLSSNLQIYELKVYDTSSVMIEDTSNLIDNDLDTVFFIPNSRTLDVLNYSFLMSFASIVAQLNKLQIYTVSDDAFSSILIQYNNSIIYTDLTVTKSSFQLDSISGKYIYEIILVPSLLNVSSLNFDFTKLTAGSIQIAKIHALYDPNNAVIQKIPSTIIELDNRPTVQSVSNIIDNNLLTTWYPTNFSRGSILRFNVTFSPAPDRINCIQIYSGLFTQVTNTITGISIFTDSSRSVQLYANLNIDFKQYGNYSLFQSNIPPLLDYNNLYIELYKNTSGIPYINEIKFFNIGRITDIQTGYSGGSIATMSRFQTAYSISDGGGGTTKIGGSPGLYGINGSYLIGGSSAILTSQLILSNTLQITSGAGGGGGGYYGGGGGGVLSNVYGGAGGGGAGYIYTQTPIFNILDYSVAIPGTNFSPQNYIAPGLVEQLSLININTLTRNSINYGQGGNPSLDSGRGGHGVIVLSYEFTSVQYSQPTSIVNPVFIDGSKLSVFQAEIIKNTNERTLDFRSYSDSIELSDNAGYNWVWYYSYLSLVGCTLLPSMVASSSIPSEPSSFPYLPISTYAFLSSIFSDVTDLFTNGITRDNVMDITSIINTAFIQFQGIFITVSYLDPSYIEMTEIYCLLDYLRSPVNLQNPHINPSNSTLDRIFGGIPRFGYWANPFLTNVSYLGFDVNYSQIPSPALSTLAQSSLPVQAMYGLVLEQSLSSGAYKFKDIMAYKPTLSDAMANGSNWLTVTQFPESYVVRSLANDTYLLSNIPVQPYTFKNAITAKLSLFKYSVYTSPSVIDSNIYNIPIQVLNDFEGPSIYLYSLQNLTVSDQQSIHISQIPLTSTVIKMNQNNINKQKISKNILGTLVSEYTSTIVQGITSFGFNGITYDPQITYGLRNYYNTFSTNTLLASSNVGNAIVDTYGNYYMTDNTGSTALFQNTSLISITPTGFSDLNISFASPKNLLTQYNNGSLSPYNDFFVSRYDNIWHFNANGILSEIYGVRFNSVYDYSPVASFANQIFYPTHKIILTKTQSIINPIINTIDTATYPSYQRTQMFFYENYSKMINDISGQFAMEKSSNFRYSDTEFSGYNFNSYIDNIILEESTNYDNDDNNSFNYLAIRAYSPSETFQSLVRFYLPQRYDFGYISLKDLSNELINITSESQVNPRYLSFLNTFNQAFSTNRLYGSIGLAGFLGSNISTTSFGDFLRQYNLLNTINTSNNNIISSITGQTNVSISKLISEDLQYILPSYLGSRNKITDPITFSIPFSTATKTLSMNLEQYGLGYNLGFPLADTSFNTVHRAKSFFKILDDYIYLQMNPEFNMNKMDVSMPENFAQTLDTTAQSGLYNSKLLLNNFGQYATTFVQSPVNFNPTLGKLDKLSFSWYDSNGNLLNNADCEWSGTIQIVEAVNIPEFIPPPASDADK